MKNQTQLLSVVENLFQFSSVETEKKKIETEWTETKQKKTENTLKFFYR